jgi:hypothetical protein
MARARKNLLHCSQYAMSYLQQLEAALTREQIIREVQRRRNFAIISHPDAGKTTLVRPAWV